MSWFFYSIFSFYFFPHHSVFPIHHLSSVCAPSLSFLYNSAMKLFFLKNTAKIVKLLFSSSLCVTQNSHFLSSQITLFGFLSILSHENVVAHCHHLVTPTLCCLINTFPTKMLSLFAPSSHISAAAVLGKWTPHKMNIRSICWLLTASENYFLQLEPFSCFTSFSINYGVEKKEGTKKSEQSRLKWAHKISFH